MIKTIELCGYLVENILNWKNVITKNLCSYLTPFSTNAPLLYP